MPAVSIIVPVYNTSVFLRRCYASLAAQTFRDWEAIFVDDGSKDSSPAMVDAFAESDPRVKVIHQANGGLSAARNSGLERACGTYIAFLDSDDFLHPQTLELSVAAAEKDGSDLVAYTYDRTYRTKYVIRHLLGLKDPEEIKYKHFKNVRSFVADDIFDWVTEYSNGKVPGGNRKLAVKHCQVWRCLYRRSAIEGIRFIKGINYEDFPWWGEVLLHIRKASILNLPLYFYYPNRQSYILSAGQQHRIDSLKIAIEAAGKPYLNASPKQKEIWEKNFMVPFRAKLEKKIKRYSKD
ncbi:MAG: glycosyltransferase [Candidatus Cryptobacteroides sp.]|nr:glycosyltransferase [Rikenellaceae bacterium]MDY5747272.1 glycosyltransferase [Candidatus Cryptobacteroides sp.]